MHEGFAGNEVRRHQIERRAVLAQSRLEVGKHLQVEPARALPLRPGDRPDERRRQALDLRIDLNLPITLL
jgi:hypothetical protein